MDTVGIFRKELQKVTVRSAQEQLDLVRRSQSGDTEAFNTLVESNLPYVVHVSGRYVGLGVDRSDLISEGSLGLMKAVETFDPDRGTVFLTYAAACIKGYMLNALAKTRGTVRLPGHVQQELYKYKKIRNALVLERASNPSHEEIMGHMEKRENQKHDLRLDQLDKENVSFDVPVEDGQMAIGEKLPAGEASIEEVVVTSVLLKRLLGSLTEDEREIITRVHGIGGAEESFAAIGRDRNRSRVMIRTTYLRAMRKVRNSPAARQVRKDELWSND